MKKIITAIFMMIAVSSLFCQQTEFPRGVFLFGDTNVDFVQMRDSLFINSIQGSASTLSSIPPIVTNDGDLNVLAYSVALIEPTSGQKLIIQAEYNYAEPLTFAYWAYKHPYGGNDGNAFKCEKTNPPNPDYMVKDVVPDNEYRYDRINYTATFRMQIAKDLTGNLAVADLIVYCKTHGNEYSA